MTAEEVITRRNQKLEVMAPVLARLISELLGPMIHADYNDMLDKGMFPEVPEGLVGRAIKVEYRSPMAIAQRASQVNNAAQALNVISPLWNVDPTAARHINANKTQRNIAIEMNATLIEFNDEDEVGRSLEEERQAAMAQQQATAARDVAAAGKDAASAIDTLGDGALRMAR